MNRWLVLMLAAGCTSEPEQHCTLVGCSDLIYLDIGTFPESSITPSSSTHASVNVCQNETCSRVTLDGVPTAVPERSFTSTFGTPTPTLIVILRRAGTDMINVVVHVQGGDETTFRDGDHYRVSFTDSTGAAVSDRTWAVEYKTSYPNGPDCGSCRAVVAVTPL